MALYFPGEVIAERYRVERELGEGGFGSVYEATELGVERRVAVKVLKLDDGRGYRPSTRARFTREARAVGQLQSPHTVTLLDSGESDGKLYMVFESVPGEDLRQIINRGRLEPRDAVHVLRQLLESLDEAHRAGILHRDIKPANIRVFEWGDNPMFVKLLDFGLARPTEHGSPGITATGELLGTPRYMSPEQLSSRPLTPASDIYSLGVVFLEMLVGAAPLQGNRWADQFDRMMTGHVFSMPELDRLGTDLIAVMQRMTARDPDQRFQSAAAIAAALGGGAQPRAAVSREATDVRPDRLPLLALAVVVVVAAAGVLLALQLDTPAPAPQVSKARTAAEEAPVRATLPRVEESADVPVLDAESAAAPDAPPPAQAVGGSAGCSRAGWQGAWSEAGIHIYTPDSYTRARKYPLVVAVVRDISSTAVSVLGEDYLDARRAAIERTRLPQVANNEGFVLLVPRGPRGWDPREAVEDVEEDVRFVREELCIDEERIFVIGDLDGGQVGFRSPCLDWVAAVAVYAHIPGAGWQEAMCEDRKPVLWISPTGSARVPIDGPNECSDYQQQTLSEWEQVWVRHNGCRKGSATSIANYGGGGCNAWSCEQPFWSCRIDGGFHWPGAQSPPRDVGQDECPSTEPIPNYPIEEVIWDFFQRAVPQAPAVNR